jgi:hypothetical protein
MKARVKATGEIFEIASYATIPMECCDSFGNPLSFSFDEVEILSEENDLKESKAPDYCDYDTCVALKELGYKVPASAYYMPHHKDLIWVSNPFRGGYVTDCFYSHNSLPKDVMTANFIDAPTLWEAQKWLREHRNIDVFPRKGYNRQNYQVEIYINYNRNIMLLDNDGEDYNSPEEALSEGVRKAVEILKEER